MGNVYPLRSIEDEASEWIARTEQGCTPEQRKRLDAWLAADPAHRSVFDEMSKHWQRLSATAAIAATLNRTAVPPNPLPRKAGEGKGGGAKHRYLTAASVLLTALAASYLAYHFSVSTPKIYTTAIGAHRTLPLTDGSTVDLNTATRIEVKFAANSRTIRLTSGEALFNVAKDPDRPFTVIAGSSVVRAVGTAFSVRVASDHTSVLVTEGRVLVSPSQSSETNQLLDAGQQVRIATAIGPIAKVEPRELDRTLAWRRGALNIQDQPLGEVIAEVERYSAVRIRIADPSLTDIKVGGYFKATDIDAFLTLLEGQFPIRAERAEPGLIVLHRRE